MNLSEYKGLSKNEFSTAYELLYKNGNSEMTEKLYRKKQESLKTERTLICWGGGLLTLIVYIYLLSIGEETSTFLVTVALWYFIGWSVKKNEWNSEKNEIMFKLATDEYESLKENDEHNKSSPASNV